MRKISVLASPNRESKEILSECHGRGDWEVIKEGDRAPDFTTIDHTGKYVRLLDLRGKKVWLWFYSSPGGNN